MKLVDINLPRDISGIICWVPTAYYVYLEDTAELKSALK